MANTIEKIKETILRHGMIRPGDAVVTGLSGGPDSTCLLHALAALSGELGISRITAVHINHGIRGGDSFRDEEYSRRVAEKCGAAFFSYRFDIPEIARRERIGTEDAGRRARYETFEKVRLQTGSQRIAVAHNMDDQAETVMMRIMRGTGLHGLRGIPYVRGDGVLIRPVLDLSRAEIEAYCSDNGLEPRIDKTNLEPVYSRNKIRLELFPLMEAEFNPDVKAALVRLAAQADEDEDYIGHGAQREFERRWNERERTLLLDGFTGLHPAVAKRVLFKSAARVGLTQNVGAVHIGKLLELISGGHEPREADLTGGWLARISYGRLWLLRRDDLRGIIGEEIPFPFTRLQSGGSAEIDAGGRLLRMSLVTGEEAARLSRRGQGAQRRRTGGTDQSAGCENKREHAVILDYDKLIAIGDVVIRNRRAGDRIHVRGMRGSKKLQDFLTDRKIPRQERDRLPLAAAGATVLWAGREAAAECAVDASTARAVLITFE